jgi:5-methylcytosine-specific restriction endonuclease McrA
MVKLTKSPLPDGVTITSPDDYRSGIVFETLINDCRHKCYICEDNPTSINVEHIVPHKSDPALKYDWDNLFIACGHCNNIKGERYSDVINPALTDPEEPMSSTLEEKSDLHMSS